MISFIEPIKDNKKTEVQTPCFFYRGQFYDFLTLAATYFRFCVVHLRFCFFFRQ